MYPLIFFTHKKINNTIKIKLSVTSSLNSFVGQLTKHVSETNTIVTLLAIEAGQELGLHLSKQENTPFRDMLIKNKILNSLNILKTILLKISTKIS